MIYLIGAFAVSIMLAFGVFAIVEAFKKVIELIRLGPLHLRDLVETLVGALLSIGIGSAFVYGAVKVGAELFNEAIG